MSLNFVGENDLDLEHIFVSIPYAEVLFTVKNILDINT